MGGGIVVFVSVNRGTGVAGTAGRLRGAKAGGGGARAEEIKPFLNGHVSQPGAWGGMRGGVSIVVIVRRDIGEPSGGGGGAKVEIG